MNLVPAAGIHYDVDQNQPSSPFVFWLDLSNPLEGVIEQCADKNYVNYHSPTGEVIIRPQITKITGIRSFDLINPIDPEEPTEEPTTTACEVETSLWYGQFQVKMEFDSFLFFSVERKHLDAVAKHFGLDNHSLKRV